VDAFMLTLSWANRNKGSRNRKKRELAFIPNTD
jgi:hypothetical protein